MTRDDLIQWLNANAVASGSEHDGSSGGVPRPGAREFSHRFSGRRRATAAALLSLLLPLLILTADAACAGDDLPTSIEATIHFNPRDLDITEDGAYN